MLSEQGSTCDAPGAAEQSALGVVAPPDHKPDQWARGVMPGDDDVLVAVDVAKVTGRSTRAVSLWIQRGLLVPRGVKQVKGGPSPLLRWGDVRDMLLKKGWEVVKGGGVRRDEEIRDGETKGESAKADEHSGGTQAGGQVDEVNWGALKSNIKQQLDSLLKNLPTDGEDQGAAAKWAQAVNTLSGQLADMEDRQRDAEERARAYVRVSDAVDAFRTVAEVFVNGLSSLEATVIAQGAQVIVTAGGGGVGGGAGSGGGDIDAVQRGLRGVVSAAVTDLRAKLAGELKDAAGKLKA